MFRVDAALTATRRSSIEDNRRGDSRGNEESERPIVSLYEGPAARAVSELRRRRGYRRRARESYRALEKARGQGERVKEERARAGRERTRVTGIDISKLQRPRHPLSPISVSFDFRAAVYIRYFRREKIENGRRRPRRGGGGDRGGGR